MVIFLNVKFFRNTKFAASASISERLCGFQNGPRDFDVVGLAVFGGLCS